MKANKAFKHQSKVWIKNEIKAINSDNSGEYYERQVIMRWNPKSLVRYFQDWVTNDIAKKVTAWVLL